MKKFIATLLALVFMVSLVSCGAAPAEEADTPVEPSNQPEQTSEPAPEEKKLSLCFICEALGDNSFNDASDNSCKAYAEQYGIDYFCTQVGAGGDVIAAMREAAQNGYSIVTTMYGAEQIAMLEEEAADYPDTLFYLFTATSDVDAGDNVVGGFFRSCEAAYMGGLVAGGMSQTKVAAFIGGQESVNLYDWMVGYVQGVERGGSSPVYSWINGENPWSDPAKAKELSKSLKNNYNADMFWGCAGQSGDGVFQAVIELREAEPDKMFWALGVDSDQHAIFEANDKEDVAEVILTSCMKNPMGPVGGFIETLLAGGKVQGGMITCGIKDGACRIADNDFYRANTPAEVQELVDTAKEEVKSGKIEIMGSYGLSIEELNAFLQEHTLNYTAANM